MKLSDFSKQSSPKKKNYPVFNLNNEKRDKAQTSKIKSLEAELVLLNKEVEGLRPLPDQLHRKGEEHRSLNEDIHNFQRRENQHKVLLERAEQKVIQATQYREDVKNLKAREEILVAEKINLERELIKSSDEINNIKQNYIESSQIVSEVSTKNNTLKSEVETLQLKFSTLEKEYFDIKNLYTSLSKINIDTKKELGRLKTERDYLEADNDAAREKINMLEGIKNRVERWASTLTKTNTESDSKLAAFEQTVQNSREVMLNMSQQIDSLIEDKKDLVELVKIYKFKLEKPKHVSMDREMRKAGMPNKTNIEDRQYIGLGVPTLLKFKPKGG